MAIKQQKVLCRGETGCCQRDSLLSADALLRLKKRGRDIGSASSSAADRVGEESKAGTEWRREASLRAGSLSMKKLRGL